MIDEVETNRTGQGAWVVRCIVMLLIGAVLGWFANDRLGTRYVMVGGASAGLLYRIDTKTGETWGAVRCEGGDGGLCWGAFGDN